VGILAAQADIMAVKVMGNTEVAVGLTTKEHSKRQRTDLEMATDT
jgi:hypothetical protein